MVCFILEPRRFRFKTSSCTRAAIERAKEIRSRLAQASANDRVFSKDDLYRDRDYVIYYDIDQGGLTSGSYCQALPQRPQSGRPSARGLSFPWLGGLCPPRSGHGRCHPFPQA
ncbi:hypothetical protein SBA1_1510008 [Candidatus Sulfotelmatobacter kueseliae]|uniref:Uncharacterized protein n=1 Tax=Candidatus Sulfotelmatobacter kueseliae TaxID=2042962 RepID=A0A2U3K9U2_9BACT|nr:hypothetical protein SBA1_1510008 [Candidatus Sulfotelmatobacter kueseliae]